MSLDLLGAVFLRSHQRTIHINTCDPREGNHANSPTTLPRMALITCGGSRPTALTSWVWTGSSLVWRRVVWVHAQELPVLCDSAKHLGDSVASALNLWGFVALCYISFETPFGMAPPLRDCAHYGLARYLMWLVPA